VVAAALVLVVFVTLADVVTAGYTRQVARAAVAEGARAGSRSEDPVPDCEARGEAVLDGLLGATARRGVVLRCSVVRSAVRAHAEVRIAPWWPGVPEWATSAEAAATREVLP